MLQHTNSFRLSRVLMSFCLVLTAIFGLAPSSHAEAKRELFYNQDDSNFFSTTPQIPEGKAGELIDRYVDAVADAGVTTFLCCVNARRTNYRSKVWDAIWDGYDPEGPDSQPFFADVSASTIPHYRGRVDRNLKVHQQGIDYPERVIQRCRQRSMIPWISLRMNDCHFNNIPTHPFHGNFWKDNPQLTIKGHTGYFKNCLDYAHPQVRNYYMALIEEVLDRYDIEGLELDFMREAYIFSKGKESTGAKILTNWIRQVRQKIDAAAAKRGHPIQLGVRVPSRPETTLKMGFEAVDWANEGLIDVLVVAPRWDTLEFDIPVEQWKDLLKDSKVKLAAGLESHYRPHIRVRAVGASAEMTTGAAAVMLARGADTIYLFNHFPNLTSKHPEHYKNKLYALGSLDTLLTKPRRVCITYRDVVASGEKYSRPLPKTGKKLIFLMKLGPVTEANESCQLLLGLGKAKNASTPPVVTVNNAQCTVASDKTSPKLGRLLTYEVPRAALRSDGPQKIKVAAPNASPVTIERVEMLLK